ncbi:Sensor histidine kinase YpdA [compost metagenome]
MSRLQYSISIPPQLRRLEIPPLVLQPLVENAVLHGIEPLAGSGILRITGSCSCRTMTLTVEDDGKGMEPDAISELENKLGRAMDEEMGCGVWNVHQRMRLRYGEEAGLSFAQSPLGGLKATLQWRLPDNTESTDVEKISGRGHHD